MVVAVGWELRFGLSYRDVEELLAERGVEVDHVTVDRWVLRFTPLVPRPPGPAGTGPAGAGWLTEVCQGRWPLAVCRSCIDQFGQVPEVHVSPRRDASAARRCCKRPIDTTKVTPNEVVTDRAPDLPAGAAGAAAGSWHRTDRYANNRVEADHGRLTARPRPMGGRKQDRSARVMIAGHGFIQNLRRGHYELAVEEPVNQRVAVALDELALAI